MSLQFLQGRLIFGANITRLCYVSLRPVLALCEPYTRLQIRVGVLVLQLITL